MKRKHYTILVDIDSTITNFGEVLLKYLNRFYNTQYTYDQITYYNWFNDTFSDSWLVTDFVYFWDDVKVNPNAVKTIEYWIKQGHEVYLCTASHFYDLLSYKIKKTLKPFDSEIINENNIIVTQNKSIINADIMIDDNINHLDKFNGLRICYTQPWNKNYITSHDYMTNSWDEINDIVQSHTYYVLP